MSSEESNYNQQYIEDILYEKERLETKCANLENDLKQSTNTLISCEGFITDLETENQKLFDNLNEVNRKNVILQEELIELKEKFKSQDETVVYLNNILSDSINAMHLLKEKVNQFHIFNLS